MRGAIAPAWGKLPRISNTCAATEAKRGPFCVKCGEGRSGGLITHRNPPAAPASLERKTRSLLHPVQVWRRCRTSSLSSRQWRQQLRRRHPWREGRPPHRSTSNRPYSQAWQRNVRILRQQTPTLPLSPFPCQRAHRHLAPHPCPLRPYSP